LYRVLGGVRSWKDERSSRGRRLARHLDEALEALEALGDGSCCGDLKAEGRQNSAVHK